MAGGRDTASHMAFQNELEGLKGKGEHGWHMGEGAADPIEREGATGNATYHTCNAFNTYNDIQMPT